MRKVFGFLKAANWTNAEQMFERIAAAEPEEWGTGIVL